MSRLSDSLKKLRSNQRIGVFLLCWTVALFVWLLNALNKRYEYTLRLPVEYQGLSFVQQASNKLPNELEVSVYGQGWDLFKIYFRLSEHKLILDYNQIESRDFVRTRNLIPYFSTQLSGRITIRKIFPESLQFKTPDLVSKKLPVKLLDKLSLKESYHLLGSPRIKPDSIEIKVPDSLASKITYIETRLLETPALEKNTRFSIELKNMENLGVFTPTNQVEVLYFVDRLVDVSRKVPVEVVNLPPGKSIRLVPNTIQISCFVPMQFYRKMQNTALKVVVDYREIQEGKRLLTPKAIDIPKWINEYRFQPRQLDYIVRNP